MSRRRRPDRSWLAREGQRRRRETFGARPPRERNRPGLESPQRPAPAPLLLPLALASAGPGSALSTPPPRRLDTRDCAPRRGAASYRRAGPAPRGSPSRSALDASPAGDVDGPWGGRRGARVGKAGSGGGRGVGARGPAPHSRLGPGLLGGEGAGGRAADLSSRDS